MKPMYIILIVIALIAGVVLFKMCVSTKQIEVKQKSTDDKTTLSIEIKKEKPEEVK